MITQVYLGKIIHIEEQFFKGIFMNIKWELNKLMLIKLKHLMLNHELNLGYILTS